jgi:signal transduction histidine kinase
MVGHGMAGRLLLKKARHFDGRERLAWTLVGTGLTIAAAGVLVVAVLGAINGTVPAFGPTDLIFVASYGLIIGGFGSLPHVAGTVSQRLRLFLDGAIGAVSLAVILWTLVLVNLIDQVGDAPFWERLIATTYPVLDAVTLALILWVAVRRSTYRFDLRLLVFVMSLVAQTAADMTFFVTGIGKTFEEATPTYGIYVLAAAGFLTVGILLDMAPAPREYADRGSPLWAMLAPYTAAGVLFCLLAYVELVPGDGRRQQVLFLGAVAVVGLVIARQAVAIRENRSLVEQQREALVSSISHELRTPLTAMIGFLDLMNEPDAIDEIERRELTNVVHQQAVYMGRIVSDLILLARGNPNDLNLTPEPVYLNQLVADAVWSVDQGDGAISLEVPHGIVVRVDPDRIQQALVNLLSNAVRYGGDQRTVRAVTSGDDLVVEVHDNGLGVPKKHELVIWQRFERGPNRYNAVVPGSGIGLAVVDTIVRVHGGEPGYRRSELLGGACFSMTLPGVVASVEPDSADDALPLADAG